MTTLVTVKISHRSLHYVRENTLSFLTLKLFIGINQSFWYPLLAQLLLSRFYRDHHKPVLWINFYRLHQDYTLHLFRYVLLISPFYPYASTSCASDSWPCGGGLSMVLPGAILPPVTLYQRSFIQSLFIIFMCQCRYLSHRDALNLSMGPYFKLLISSPELIWVIWSNATRFIDSADLVDDDDSISGIFWGTFCIV